MSTTTDGMTDERKVEILEALNNDQLLGLVSVRPGSEGVILYERGATSVGGEPAIEIPHEDPYLNERPRKSFEELLSEYGCVAKHRGPNTYVVVDEHVCSKRPQRSGGDDGE